MTKTAVVTGASSGIGAATARRLAAEGYDVVAGRAAAGPARQARRRGRPADPRRSTLDVTSQESVDALAASLDRCDVLVNNAGGAIGLEPVAEADVDDWQRMYDVNVLGSLRVTQALLPEAHRLRRRRAACMLTSTAGLRLVRGRRRLQRGQARPVRDGRDAPARAVRRAGARGRGRARHGEDRGVLAHPLPRRRRARRGRSTQGVPDPLTADDVADAIAWCVTRPAHVNIDRLVIRPRAQAAQHKVAPRRPRTHRASPRRRTGGPAGARASSIRARGPVRGPARSGRSPAAPPGTTGCGASDRWIAAVYGPLLRRAAPPARGRPRLRRLAGHHAGAVHPAARGAPARRGRRRRDRPGAGRRGQAVRAGGAVVRARRLRAAGAAGRPLLVRAFNVLRQYGEAEAWAAWDALRARLAPGRGARRGHLLGDRPPGGVGGARPPRGPRTLTFAARFAGFDRPSDLAERLPKTLIHRNVPGERMHAFLRDFDRAWAPAPPYGAFGTRQRWIETAGACSRGTGRSRPRRRSAGGPAGGSASSPSPGRRSPPERRARSALRRASAAKAP